MKDNIEHIMEHMEQPTVDVSNHQKEFRLTLLNTKKSSILGLILLILPLLFLSGVIFKHYMQIDLGIFTSVYEWIGDIDRKYGDSSVLNWVIRILLVFGPLAAIAINLISILHVRYEKTQKEIIMSLKVKWLNWTIIAVCSIVFIIFFLYLTIENAT
ncbi:MAG TPA: hypothetical protein VKN14_12745 [Flavobacteriaceae bacterium]|nr:hypothetical protein [Flavobacteriaceae bacterium]